MGRGKAAAQLVLTQSAMSELLLLLPLLLPLLPTLLLKPLLLLTSQMATLGQTQQLVGLTSHLTSHLPGQTSHLISHLLGLISHLPRLKAVESSRKRARASESSRKL